MEISVGREVYDCGREACVGFGEIIMVIFGVKEQKNRRILQLERTVYKNDCLV